MKRVYMGEGNTPLVPSIRIAAALNCDHLFFKLENLNPSGSYKDRFAAAEVSRMLASGTKGCLATSSGNTGAALAAYCARHNLSCMIVVNSDTAHGKLAQMQAHGARVLSLQGFTASPRVLQSTIETLTEIAGECGLSFVVSAYRFCPIGMIGVEAIARELLQQCETPIDHIFVPLGGGGLFAAICRGFEKEQEPRPRIHAVQPTGCPTVLGAFQRGDDNIRPVDSTTRISGLSVPFDIDAGLALRRLRQSGGVAFGVSDEEVFEAQQMLFSHEGLYAEPAGAAALAGLCRARREGIVSSADTVVCLVTGHGFKDPESISLAASRHPVTSVEADALRDTIQSLAKCG